MKMNKLNSALCRIGGGVATVLFVAGAIGSAPALAGIKDTRHNLGTSGTWNKSAASGGTAEICVFCHTPHGSDTSAVVPLWNKKMSDPDIYTTYNSLGTSSLDGNTAPVGSVSLACLSCHDGTQAMNVMINKPGSGGYASGGGEFGTMVAGLGGALTNGLMPSASVAMLSKDLQNDHPIGIQYGGGPGSSGVIAVTGTYNNFADTDFQPASAGPANGKTVWWVNTSGGTSGGVTVAGTTAREKTDMQLYSRNNLTFRNVAETLGSDDADVQPFVECASCHDPHSTNVTFLRIENNESRVCLACHIK
jgi:predicted CXXCH cytochrome family protein